jgi:hypothetical protein
MKLYIPTTTLNIDNILSTESISPYVFYKERTFGIKQFEQIEQENNFFNIQLLYSKYPMFNIDKKGIESYSMVIEVEIEEKKVEKIKHIEEENVDVYLCRSTIYTNPFETKFYFNDEMSHSDAKIKVERSAQTKFFELYQNSFSLRPNDIKCFDFQKIKLDEIKDDNNCKELNEKEDNLINRIKGFAYCYLIGAYLKTSEEIATLNSLGKTIENQLSAYVNDPSKNITLYNNLNNSTNAFNKTLEKIYKSKIIANFNKIIKDKGWEENGEHVYYIFKKCNLESRLYENLYNIQEILHATKNNYMQSIERLYKAITSIEKEHTDRIKSNISDLFSVKDLKEIIIKDNTYHKLVYEELINKLINTDSTTSKKDIAEKGTICVKENMGDKWENSEQRKYLNNFRHNINGEEVTFNLKDETSNVLQSFVAFTLKGTENNTMENLTDYLIVNKFNDYRLAWGLFGAIKGFATIKKTFLQQINDLDYLQTIYKELYKELFNIEIQNNIPEEKIILKPIINNTGKEDEITKLIKDNHYLTDKNIKKWIKIQFDKHFKTKKELIDYAKTNKIKINKNALNWFKDNTKNEEPLTLFTQKKFFYSDPKAWDYIKDLIPKERQKNIEVNLKWFQDELGKKKEDRKYYQTYEQKDIENNENMIDAYINTNKDNNKFDDDLKEKLLKRLKEKYV